MRTILTNEQVLDFNKYYTTKNCYNNVHKSHVYHNGRTIYNKYDNKASINNIHATKDMSQHVNDSNSHHKPYTTSNSQQHLTN